MPLISLPLPLETPLSTTSAHTLSGTGHQATRRIVRCCQGSGLKGLLLVFVRQRWELATPWPSRRASLHEDAASIRIRNDESGNAGGPITIADCSASCGLPEIRDNRVPAFGRPGMPTSSASRISSTDSVCHDQSCVRIDSPDSSAY